MKPTEPPADADSDDWRLHAVARLAKDWNNPWSGKTVPKGSRLTVSSIIQLTKKKRLTIPLPNASALLLNASANAFFAARLLREQSEIDKTLHTEISFKSDKEAFDYLERMIEAIVLAFTALEAFVNESVPNEFIYARHDRSDIVLEAVSKAKIERHISIDEKLTSVLPEVLNCQSPKGSRCWQSYKQLKDVRDRIIHMKTEDRKSSGPDIETVWKAILLVPAPHLVVKAVVDHFAKSMQNKPAWHSRFPHGKT